MAARLSLPLAVFFAYSACVEAYSSVAAGKAVSLDATSSENRPPLMRRDQTGTEEEPDKQSEAEHFDVLDDDDDEAEQAKKGKTSTADEEVLQPKLKINSDGKASAEDAKAAIAEARKRQQQQQQQKKRLGDPPDPPDPEANSPLDSVPTFEAKIKEEEAEQKQRDAEHAQQSNGEDGKLPSDVGTANEGRPRRHRRHQHPHRHNDTENQTKSSYPVDLPSPPPPPPPPAPFFHGPWFPERVNQSELSAYREPVDQGLTTARTVIGQILSKAEARKGNTKTSTRGEGPEIEAPQVNGTARDTALYKNITKATGATFEVVNNTLATLFVVISSSKTKATSLAWLLDTWGSTLPKENLLVISDNVGASSTHQTHESNCPTGGHWTGDCCRWSEAVVVANQAVTKSKGALKWAFFIKDSAYVRPYALGSLLSESNRSKLSMGHVMGDFVCSTSSCEQGLCEGGGMALDAMALATLIGASGDERSFLERHLHSCGSCGKWPTLGLTEMFKQFDIQQSSFSGTYPWRLSKACFDGSLQNDDDRPYGPLMYNNLTSQDQMTFLHELFVSAGTQSTTVFPYPDQDSRCVTFESTYKCMEGAVWDTPWDPRNITQDCNLMD